MNASLFYEGYRDEPVIPTCYFEKNNNNIPHFHNCIELMYITNGELEATVSGNQIKLCKGDLFVVPTAEVHMFKCAGHVKDTVLMIPVNYISTFEKLFSAETFSEYIIKGERAREIFGFMSKIAQCDEKRDSPIIRGYTYLILGTVMQTLNMKQKPVKDNLLVRNLARYVEQNYADQITIKSVAEEFAYNESSMSRFFNQAFGCGLPEYLGRLRAGKAAYLLVYEDSSVTDAAMKSGFESFRSFYRTFKKYYGTTPLQYKKRVLANSSS